MAARLLLTLLALLTGFAAQISPAQARIRADGASEIGAFAAIVQGERAAVARPTTRFTQSDRRWWRARCTAVMMRADADCVLPVMLAPVMLRIDRARE